MSEFDYRQRHIREISERVEQEIRSPPEGAADYDEQTVGLLLKAALCLREAYVYAERVDRLLSGDDSPEAFAEKLNSDMADAVTQLFESL